MSRFRRGALLLLAPVLLIALTVALVGGWLLLDERGDPDRLVAAPLPDVGAATVQPYAGRGCPPNRVCRDVVLEPAAGPPVRFALSLPRRAGGTPLPTVLLAGGLRTGREALRYVPDVGRNALLAYEYPLAADHWRGGFLPARIASTRDLALAVPGQLAAVVRWTRAQPWADPARISLVGVSLGALVLPAAQRTAAAHGLPVGATVLAYGGTDLAAILRANLAPDRPWAAIAAAWLAGVGLRALEPAAHLQNLDGPFLLLNGADDPRIPPASIAGLRRLTPAPKAIRTLSAGHIDTADEPLLAEILAISRAWLVDRGALNPRRETARRRARPAAGHSAGMSQDSSNAGTPSGSRIQGSFERPQRRRRPPGRRPRPRRLQSQRPAAFAAWAAKARGSITLAATSGGASNTARNALRPSSQSRRRKSSVTDWRNRAT